MNSLCWILRFGEGKKGGYGGVGCSICIVNRGVALTNDASRGTSSYFEVFFGTLYLFVIS